MDIPIEFPFGDIIGKVDPINVNPDNIIPVSRNTRGGVMQESEE